MEGYDDRDIRGITYRTPTRLLDEYHASIFEDEGMASRFSREFLDRGRQAITRARESRAYRATQSAYRKLKNRGRVDNIHALNDIGALQHAPSRMQRYVMAHPVVRERWIDKRISGYEDGYNSNAESRNAVRHSHSTYRCIMDGVVNKEGNEVTASTYALSKEERASLTELDKSEIRATWARVNEAIWDNLDDPTSQYNARL